MQEGADHECPTRPRIVVPHFPSAGDRQLAYLYFIQDLRIILNAGSPSLFSSSIERPGRRLSPFDVPSPVADGGN